MNKIILLLIALIAPSFVQATETKSVYMTVWRGCEEACQGFFDYIETNNLPVEITLRNANRDKTKLAEFLEEAKSLSPDLVVTWGTSVSKAIIGTRDEFGDKTKLGDIPALFMIVADPVGAGIIDSPQTSGRSLVTGIRNRIDEEVQIRVMREYFPVDKIGVVYSTAELNSNLNTQKLKSLEEKMEFETVIETYELDENGKPLPGQFDGKMQKLVEQGADVVYVGSSSYNLSNRDDFTSAAVANGLPVASAYDSMVTESNALISVSNKYYRVGQLAANQAEKVLFEGVEPGTLPIAELSSYSISINMEVARIMSIFPPIQLLRFAELVNVDVK
ncbi:ABC transporter substrate-binding protein [Vibrio sp. D404a]|uniref:ABC transporter substrate-binding protein n=1 Tax=unclassified Vibrio TaxID=2614977 RepID=UPI002557BFE6|nr:MULTISPECIES: ABC transporter substrate-binding protein [unclassified Vibrio]MDK9736381.1 ABC transporter substrate-binding protein [Vibrio sp. D404a]MDK9796003.1 ABC transporter substrate-binding protein [Vibrio sp. D449a]